MSEIESFVQLPSYGNSLYVLDIDETTIYYLNNCDDKYLKTIEEFEKTMNRTKAFDQANRIWESNLYKEDPIVTDPEGMDKLQKFCRDNNSKIVFLTARMEHVRDITEKQMLELFRWLKKEDIYICNGTEKGTVLKNILKDHKNYDHVVFVDDKDYNIKSVQRIISQVECFQFSYKV